MTKEIFIHCTSFETRLALVEDAVLQQIHIDRGEAPSLVGNIYKAKVLRVMPGMQSAFVDIGSERNAFLHIDDIYRANPSEKIADNLREGQDLLVQVVKDPVNKKGALLTTDLSIATKYLVYRHGRKKLGISAKIKQKPERIRLNDLMDSMISTMELPESLTGHFILRSAAEGITASQLTQDINALLDIWQSMDSLRAKKSPVSLYQESQKFQSLITNMLGLGVNKITVDCAEFHEKLKGWCSHNGGSEKYSPELHTEKNNLFECYQIEDQINAALESGVSLNCGGDLVIEETEALSVIDVNTGSYLGDAIDQQTFLRVNLEAASESARQIKLRNLSGIIVIDFIDMAVAEHCRQVLSRLKREFAKDSTKTIISEFTELGLVQIARKRTRQSLSQVLCEPCTCCKAKGIIKSEETLSYEILRELAKVDFNGAWTLVEIHASANIIHKLRNKYTAQINQFKASADCDVKLCIESSIPSDQFNIIPV
ncbi:MAG: ribonuclease E/G [Porticoccaceae bacterium]|nr:ribonuclease E/G [Porticoccaceae bacterium]